MRLSTGFFHLGRQQARCSLTWVNWLTAGLTPRGESFTRDATAPRFAAAIHPMIIQHPHYR